MLGSKGGSVDINSLSTARYHQPPLLHQPQGGSKGRGSIHLYVGQLHPQIIPGRQELEVKFRLHGWRMIGFKKSFKYFSDWLIISLKGISMSLLYCFFNSEVQKTIKRLFKRNLTRFSVERSATRYNIEHIYSLHIFWLEIRVWARLVGSWGRRNCSLMCPTRAPS